MSSALRTVTNLRATQLRNASGDVITLPSAVGTLATSSDVSAAIATQATTDAGLLATAIADEVTDRDAAIAAQAATDAGLLTTALANYTLTSGLGAVIDTAIENSEAVTDAIDAALAAYPSPAHLVPTYDSSVHTTDATPTLVGGDVGTALTLTVNNTLVFVHARIAASTELDDLADEDYVGGTVSYAIRRNDAGTISHSPIDKNMYYSTNAEAWDVTLNAAGRLLLTGAAGKTISWNVFATVDSVVVAAA